MPAQSMLVLLPATPLYLKLAPYDLIDIFVPVEQLESNSDYWIKASFDGGHAIELIMKRKPIEFPNIDNSDFVRRFSGLGLKDHRYPS